MAGVAWDLSVVFFNFLIKPKKFLSDQEKNIFFQFRVDLEY